MVEWPTPSNCISYSPIETGSEDTPYPSALMPHIIVKLWPGKTVEQKSVLSEKITRDVMETLGSSSDSISVAFEEVSPAEWKEKVYEPDIRSSSADLFKEPGYEM